ncbi:MAG: hypothetical protein P4M08_14820 [Oligoflexia bacterium]|nr:hypothetical protein [Oligoflexia bacterium]
MKLTKPSFLVALAVTFTVGYGLSSMAYLFFSNLSFYDDNFSKSRKLRIVDELDLGTNLLKHDEVEGLRTQLASAHRARDIDFYLLKRKDEPLFFDDTRHDFGKLSVSFVPNQIRTGDEFSYGTIAVGDYLLVAGVYEGRWHYLKTALLDSLRDFVIDMVIVALMLCGISIYFFKDIRRIIKAIRQRDAKEINRLRGAKSATHEAAVITEGLRAYQSQLTASTHERENLRKNVRHSVRRELDSGRAPPYQFECVMVRTDINNYSTLYLTQPTEPFIAVIDELFTKASAVVERYGGYVTDFVGDEIIYYFKESEHENAAAVALSAIRDIHQIASDLDQKIRALPNGYDFKVKSAMAQGSLRFGPQAGGLALSGGVFVETVRILSQIDEKQQNSVYFPSRLAPRLADVCISELKKTVALRGVAGETEIHAVTQYALYHRAVREEDNVRSVQFFRGDADLCAALEDIAKPQTAERRAKTIRSLRVIGTPSLDPEVRDRYIDTFLAVVQEGDLVSMASLLSVAKQIVAVELYDEHMRRVFERGLGSKHRRVVANAIDALIYYEPTVPNLIIENIRRHAYNNADNRVIANVWIQQGLVKLNETVIAGLRKMVRSPEFLFRASGAFAIGELARHYRSENRPCFETHFPFHELLAELVPLLQDENESVRRQSKRALEHAHYSGENSGSLRVA